MTEITGELKFPIVGHHRLIIRAEALDLESTRALFENFDLVEPLQQAHVSAGGKYVSLALSVRLQDRAEMNRLDEQIKLVPGLKMVL